MKTAGYDVVLLLNEKFLNQISGALLYNGFFTFNGSEDLCTRMKPDQLAKIPVDLRKYLKLGYRFKLNYEPFVDFQEDQKLGFSFDIRCYFWFWEGLELKFDLACSVVVPIANEDGRFSIKFETCEVKELRIKTQYSMDSTITVTLNKIIEDAIHAYFRKKENHFSIALPTLDTFLPYTYPVEKNKFGISLKALKTVGSESMVAAFNLMGYKGGNPDELSDFARNSSVGIAVAEMAMNKVFNFFWDHTYLEKSFYRKDTFHINLVDDVLGVLTKIADFITSTAIKFVTFGFVDEHVTYLGSDFEYTIDVNFNNKPTFDISAGNLVSIYNFGFDLFLRLQMYVTVEHTLAIDTSGPIPDECTPWDDDKVISKERKTIKVFDIGVPVKNIWIRKATGEIILDEKEHALVCKVKDFDFRLSDFIGDDCIFLKLPAVIIDLLVAKYKQKIIDVIPPFVVSPKISFDISKLTDKIDPIHVTPGLTVAPPDIPWKLNVELNKLEITDSEAIVAALASFDELNRVIFPVPKYVVNENNHEIHKSGCDSIMDTYELHQKGYYLLDQALKNNNDGCKKCLPAYHKK